MFADENGGIEWMHKRLSCELKFFDIFIELYWAKIRPIRPSSPPPSSFMTSNQGRRIIQNFGGSTKTSSDFFI